MTPQSDQSFQDDLARTNSRHWLIKSLYAMVILEIVMIILTLVLIFMIASQCTHISGISLRGSLFKTDSFSCPSPEIERLYPRPQS